MEQELRRRQATKQAQRLAQTEAKARTKDSLKAFSKLTYEVDGQARIVSDPPLIVPIAELAEGAAVTAEQFEHELRDALPQLPAHAAA